MLWIVQDGESHEIISCNTYFRDGKHQLWIERPNGKTRLIAESEDKKIVEEIKEAIDYAIEHGHKTLRLA
jgi:hypothetical protein